MGFADRYIRTNGAGNVLPRGILFCDLILGLVARDGKLPTAIYAGAPIPFLNAK